MVLFDQIVVICQFFELGRMGQALQVGLGRVSYRSGIALLYRSSVGDFFTKFLTYSFGQGLVNGVLGHAESNAGLNYIL